MDKINEILQDEKILKKGGYQIDMLSENYSKAGKNIADLQLLKVNLESASIDHLFALNGADMFDEEEGE